MKHIALLAVLLCGCSPKPGEAFVDKYFDPFERDYAKTNFVLAVKGDYVQYRYWLGGRWHTNSTSLWIFQRIVRKVPSPTPKAERAAVRAELDELSNAVASLTSEPSYTNITINLAPDPTIVAEFRYLDGNGNNTTATNLLFKTKYRPILTGCDENGWWTILFEEDAK